MPAGARKKNLNDRNELVKPVQPQAPIFHPQMATDEEDMLDFKKL